VIHEISGLTAPTATVILTIQYCSLTPVVFQKKKGLTIKPTLFVYRGGRGEIRTPDFRRVRTAPKPDPLTTHIWGVPDPILTFLDPKKEYQAAYQ